MVNDNDAQYVLSTSAGYAFVVRMADLQSKNRGGKAILSVPEGARVLPPTLIREIEGTEVAVVTNTGRLLVHQLAELPELPRGKGVKTLSVASDKVRSGAEHALALMILEPGQRLTVHAGKRYLTLRGADLDGYRSARGKRGRVLPRGFQRVESLTVE
jgi:topoisomerase-4 subunit A